jgi:hypothetical protein
LNHRSRPNVWHEAKCDGGKMLTIFKNGEFDVFLEQLSTMTAEQFVDAALAEIRFRKFDIYEEDNVAFLSILPYQQSCVIYLLPTN